VSINPKAPGNRGLTARQFQALAIILEETRHGRVVTLQTIMQTMKIRSAEGILCHLHKLAWHDLISWGVSPSGRMACASLHPTCRLELIEKDK
jgi:hypothetical protein